MQGMNTFQIGDNFVSTVYRKPSTASGLFYGFQRITCPTFDLLIDSSTTQVWKIVNGVFTEISSSISTSTVWRSGIWDGSRVVLFANEKIAWSSNGTSWTVGGTLPYSGFTNRLFKYLTYFDNAFWGVFQYTSGSNTSFVAMRNITDLTSAAGWVVPSQPNAFALTVANEFMFCPSATPLTNPAGYRYSLATHSWSAVSNATYYYDAIRYSTEDSTYYSYIYNSTTNAIDIYTTSDGTSFTLINSKPINHRIYMNNEAAIIKLTSEFLVLLLNSGDDMQGNLFKFGKNGSLIEVTIPLVDSTTCITNISEVMTDPYGKYYFMSGTFGGSIARIMR